jgi:hypothetical protein
MMAIERIAWGLGKGRRRANIMPTSAKAPNVVRAQATVIGPYPRRAIDTTINVPPQINPRAKIENQFAVLGWDVMIVSNENLQHLMSVVCGNYHIKNAAQDVPARRCGR